MARKVQLPVKISEERRDRMDRACQIMAGRAGVPVTRTTFVEKAIDQLCSQVEDDQAQRNIEARNRGPF